MSLVGWLLAAAGLVAGAVGALWAWQERLIFPIRHAGVPVAATGAWALGEVEVPSAGRLRFLHAEGQAGDGPIALYFHGNASSAALASGYAGFLPEAGFATVLASYPGYSDNPGAPSEAALRRTAEALAAWARARWPGRQLLVWGESIGTHPAAHLASLGSADAVVLDSPFTDLREAAAAHFSLLPWVRRLVRHRMDNLGPLQAMPRPVPVLVLVAAHDPVVPVAMGERIAAEIPGAALLRSPLTAHPVAISDAEAARAAARWARERLAVAAPA